MSNARLGLVALVTMLAACSRGEVGGTSSNAAPAASTAAQGAPVPPPGNLTVGAVVEQAGAKVRVSRVALAGSVEGSDAKPAAGQQFLLVDVKVVAVPAGKTVETPGFQIVAGARTYAKPGFLMEIELFGKRQKAVGSDGAAAQLGADAAATLWFEVPADFELASARLEYKAPAAPPSAAASASAR